LGRLPVPVRNTISHRRDGFAETSGNPVDRRGGSAKIDNQKGRTMNAAKFREAIHILLNFSFDELADAGVLNRWPDGTPAEGGSDWKRFNDDLGFFILKLPDDRLEALWKMVEARQPKRDATPDNALKYQLSEVCGTIEEYLEMPCVSLRARMGAAMVKARSASLAEEER
jgi:hypothetical protein